MPPLSISTRRRWALAVAIYVAVTAVILVVMAPALRVEHTAYNHFALLAESWLKGRLSLPGAPPEYAGGNDFALHDGKWYVTFPPFPAVLLVPIVWLAGSAERVPDGLVFGLFAGLGPAVLFLALEKLRRIVGVGSEARSVGFAVLGALGTPYFFSASQGTVWYAAHVVGVALMALYCHSALGAERPLTAGIALGLGLLTRSPLVFAAPLFVTEAWAVASGARLQRGEGRCDKARPRVDWSTLVGLLGRFSLPVVLAVTLTLFHNQLRFGDPFEPGYRFLTVRWQSRMEEWGLFHYHYLARNLGVMLTSLPWTGGDSAAPFRINGHGLALWFTSPFLLWVAHRSQSLALSRGLWASVAAVALPTLLYQNSGWVQFGYRFANDYIVLLMMLIYLVELCARPTFAVLAAWSVVVNAFGALTFERPEWASYYTIEPTQTVIYEPD